MVRHRERQKIRLHRRVIAVCARAPSWGSSALTRACSQSQFSLLLLFSLILAAAQHDSGNDSRLMFSDEIVSCYKDPAELVLFHDVEIKGNIREGASAGSWSGSSGIEVSCARKERPPAV